ncbi:MAG: aminoacyl-tRNA hydrolase [Parasporobacterium sp.]|nr:aminoacyl-tRNA hydrolase [Parasporobacterium sp.]
MFLIAGLGNPTKKYEHTRHNAGFDCIDILASRLAIKVNKIRSNALTGAGTFGGEKVVLIKPQTYMNLSGQAIQELMHFYKTDPEHLIVIYDDTDLDVGKLRIRKNGSAGGHNGMKDIIKMIGTQEFPRIRVGIGHRPEYMDMVDFVLGRPQGDERRTLDEALEKAAMAAEDIIAKGMDHAMNSYN